MSILKKAVNGEWITGVSSIEAAEMDSLGRILRQLALPGLLSPALTATLAHPVVDGTQVHLGDFAANDLIFTAGAICESYHRSYVDFATAGDDGGPLPGSVGIPITYNIYLELFEPETVETPTPVPYQCYPIATAGNVDQTTYLLVATVIWNGATLTSLTDERTEQWGIFRGDYLARGQRTLAYIGDPNPADPAGDRRPLQIGQFLTALVGATIKPVLQIGDGTNQAGVILDGPPTGANIFQLLAGAIALMQTITLSNGGSGSSPAAISIKLENLLNLVFDPYSQLTINAAAKMLIDATAAVTFTSGDFPGTPAANQFTGASMVKAWANVNADDSMVAKFNVDVITISSPGVYQIKFLKGFTDPTKMAIITTVHTSDGSLSTAISIPPNEGYDCAIKTFNAAGSPTDLDFNFIVVGGDQAT